MSIRYIVVIGTLKMYTLFQEHMEWGRRGFLISGLDVRRSSRGLGLRFGV